MKALWIGALILFAVILLFLGYESIITGGSPVPPAFQPSANPNTSTGSKYITNGGSGLIGSTADKLVTYQAAGVADFIAGKTGIPASVTVGGTEAYLYAATPVGNAVAAYDAVTHPIDTAKKIGSAAASAWHSVSSIF